MDKEEILKRVDFRTVYKTYFPDLKVSGDYSQVSSPFRSDSKPSFTIYWKDGGYKDFGSGQTGDIFDFIQRIENTDFQGALKKLADSAGLPYNNGKTKKKLPAIKKADLQTSIKLLQSDKIKFLSEKLTKRKIKKDVCRFYNIGAGTFYGNPEIIFPYDFDKKGNVTAYKKFYWKNSKKQQATRPPLGLFPLDQLKFDDIILCAGEFDVLSLISAGFNAITTGYGETTFKREWAEKFLNKDVILLYDYDEPGKEGAEKAATVLHEFVSKVRIASWENLPDFNFKKGYDTGDFFEENRELDDLIEVLDRSKEFFPRQPEIVDRIRTENETRKKENLKDDLKDEFYDFTNSGKPILKQRNVAEYLASEYHICASEKGSKTVFYRYNEGIWQEISHRIVRKIILDLLLYDTSAYQLRSILDIFADITFVHEDVFDNYPDLLPLNNCIFDLKNLKALKFDPYYKFTFKNQYDYDPTAECPEFKKALKEYSMNDSEWITVFWEIAGYCLTGTYEIQKMFWFTGSKGGNGKGTVTRVMQKLTGVELTKPNLSPSKLDGQFYKGALIGKRLAITADAPAYIKNIETIKELTGGDRQSTDVKFGSQRDFENSAKLVLAMNRMPTFSANEPIEPILRRIVLLPFEHTLTKFDPGIEAKFERELSGIFNNAVLGLNRIRRQGGFSYCERGEKQLKIYAGTLNSFQEFITEHLVFGPKHEIWLWELWTEYKKFMTEIAGDHWELKREHITNRTKFRSELQARSGNKIRSEKKFCQEKMGSEIKYKGVTLKKYITEQENDVEF